MIGIIKSENDDNCGPPLSSMQIGSFSTTVYVAKTHSVSISILNTFRPLYYILFNRLFVGVGILNIVSLELHEMANPPPWTLLADMQTKHVGRYFF